ncbi:MAG: tRNA (N6-threonylcarbamoyladenosine(37)-N6)-methyltransferase TrmO [Bacteroidetes bacterium]|nr:tRNA (N6-threonylcarbamoyladenosine(37)-N6)-methyltransferase TrmO [Bacteroidota bacterium]
MQTIGYVHSPVALETDEGWGNAVAEIHLYDDLAAGLHGLTDFSHAVIVFLMHHASFDPARHLLRAPRDRNDMPRTGIFAQRAKHRPNPIGITTVPILGIAPGVLRVRGLDAIDGTPVLDIKPYVPAFDAVENPTVPEWMDRLMHGYFD